MDEKYLELRAKLDHTRDNLMAQVKKAKQESHDLRLKYSLSTNGLLLDAVNMKQFDNTGMSMPSLIELAYYHRQAADKVERATQTAPQLPSRADVIMIGNAKRGSILDPLPNSINRVSSGENINSSNNPPSQSVSPSNKRRTAINLSSKPQQQQQQQPVATTPMISGIIAPASTPNAIINKKEISTSATGSRRASSPMHPGFPPMQMSSSGPIRPFSASAPQRYDQQEHNIFSGEKRSTIRPKSATIFQGAVKERSASTFSTAKTTEREVRNVIDKIEKKQNGGARKVWSAQRLAELLEGV